MAEEQSSTFTFPATMTEPCITFVYTGIQVASFFQDFRAALLRSDLLLFADFRDYLIENQITTTETGEEIEDIDRYAMQEIEAAVRTTTKVFNDHGLFLLQTMHARVFDAYLSYLTDLLERIYRTLMSKLSPDDAELSTFAQELIDEHRDKVSHGNRDILYAEYKKRLGLPLFLEGEQGKREREVWIAEVRNAIAHHRGVATAKFLQRVQKPQVVIHKDQPIPLTLEQVMADVEFLFQIVIDLDERAAVKFSLPRQPNPFPKLARQDERQEGSEQSSPSPAPE